MRKIGTAVVIVAVALAGFGVGSAAAAYIEPYTGPGEWFAPGSQRHADYDWCGGYWTGNHFSRSGGRLGLVTFINLSGGWRYSKQGTQAHLYSTIPPGAQHWIKKPLCRNNSGYWYQGGCWGVRDDPYPCA